MNDTIFHLAASAEASSGDPALPFIYNIGGAVCAKQESDKCELTSVRVAVMGCCPFRVYLCHGDASEFEHIWYGSNVDKHKDVLAVVASNWIGASDHYAVIECNKCQVRVHQDNGPLNVVVAWGGMANNTATKIDVSGTITRGWRPVAIKAGGKTVLDYEGGIQLGRQFSNGKSVVRQTPAKEAKKKAPVKKGTKVVRKTKVIKASGKKILKSTKSALKKKVVNGKKIKTVKKVSGDWRSIL